MSLAHHFCTKRPSALRRLWTRPRGRHFARRRQRRRAMVRGPPAPSRLPRDAHGAASKSVSNVNFKED